MPTEETQSCDLSLAPSTTSTSLLDSGSHIARISARTTKHTRRGSLGLIDAARVRLSKDFHSLIRSNNKLQRFHSVSSVQTAGTEDDRFVYPDYAQNLPSHLGDLDIELMELLTDERHGRGFGAKIANFLSRSRSRSRSKKRRSRSLDAAASHMPMPLEGAPSTMHARHSSLDADEQESPAASCSTPRPVIRSPSRPLSSTTTATNTTIKPLPKKPPKSISVPPSGISRNDHPVHIHTEVVSLEQSALHSTRKGKKMNIFGITLPSPRKGTFGESSKPKSRSITPGPTNSQPSSKDGERGLWSGRFRSGSGSTSHRSHEDSKHFIKGDILYDDNQPALPDVGRPQPRPTPIHVFNGPPHPRGEYSQVEDDLDDAKMNDLGGRCSPLCGLGSPNMTNATLEKGKERERMRGARGRSREEKERERELWAERGKEKERDRITHPRRVGSPIIRERERESRPVVTAAPMEKVASGSGNSRQSRGRDGLTTTNPNTAGLTARAKRTKHGSFDFERPVSAGGLNGGQVSVKVALRNMDLGGVADTHAMQRSLSARGLSRREREADGHLNPRTRQPAPASTSLQNRGKTQPNSELSAQNYFLTRRTTGSSNATSTQPRSHLTPHSRANLGKSHNGSDTDPGSPISSHSGNSSAMTGSWGRNTGKRMARPTHPPFKFEPAVPPIPGSPARDNQKPSAAAATANGPRSGPPMTKSNQTRTAGRGRSLDLGLGLSWAPSKVREEAVLRPGRSHINTNTGPGTRVGWRGGAVDEQGRLGTDRSGVASDVAEAFRDVLGDAAYTTFKNCAYLIAVTSM
ncbi:hypothetical protein AcW1_004475 [Taiwanofungus camphoratus]|nr:hypothetical protein AcW2_006520 [Antrodia cinnamomea]KAI0939425.1 hypothetical protein AcV5_000850 [Antrodia cinnamomea]KAI0952350.1 hypothetical protein AcV7_008190 [Antrodia cinnamomea]KAI0959734.1 hypothetical protein AcW1_004475 [Antrodia cinnamomea]